MIKIAPLALLFSAVLFAGCTSAPDVPQAARSGKNVRIERMEHLGVVEEAYWHTEQTKDLTAGDDPVAPWVQGVARMSKTEFDRLFDAREWRPVSTEPIIPVDLKGKLDTGDSWFLGELEDGVYYLETDTRFVLFMVWP
ncbi:hypothetical protein AB0M36_20990 [Actinoplanes sp. NPDC051346]|uniref:hypothetical protein n=1 Tax=Actinoplanes sp. NPDC051346 TaxID=3155048 RepID=UPI00341E4BBD